MHYHHWTMNECSDALIKEYLKNNTLPQPGMCVNNEVGQTEEWANMFNLCRKVSLVWAVGGSEIQDFPDHLGYPIGGANDSFTYFFLEIHYNNPKKLPSREILKLYSLFKYKIIFKFSFTKTFMTSRALRCSLPKSIDATRSES